MAVVVLVVSVGFVLGLSLGLYWRFYFRRLVVNGNDSVCIEEFLI